MLPVALLVLALLVPATALAAPGAPDKVRAKERDAVTIVVSWRDRSRSETRFEVRYRRTDTGRGGLKRVGRNRTSWAHRVKPGIEFAYRVRACDRSGCSAWSRVATARTRRPPAGASPTIGGCPVFPADNPWNQDVSRLPVHPRSDAFIRSIGPDDHLHPDWGGGGEYGIPYEVVPASQPEVPITFTAYGDESDPGPYPIPPDARVEGRGEGDSHVLVVRQGECKLYEMFVARRSGSGWSADSGAVFDLRSNRVRPKYWTSADAAGLPILPGLARWDEAESGQINHALRFTVSRTQRGFIFPARHFASSSTDPDLPPMGLRLRLKASYDVSRFRGHARVILTALKRYGMIVADNGSDWYITGAMDTRWDDDDVGQLKSVPGSAFEVVDTGPIER